jgi:hypothetical protein
VPTGERYIDLLACVDRICQANEWRKQAFEKALRLYSAIPMLNFGGGGIVRPMSMRGGRLSLNVIKSVSDTFVSMVTHDDPKISVVTDGGDWSLQQRAKLLEKFIDGQCYESGVNQRDPLVVLDGGGLFGKGYYKTFVRGEGERARIIIERVAPWEIQIDDQDGQYGDPRCMYQRKWIDRFVLLRLYKDDPKKVDAIRRAQRSVDPHTGTTNPLSNADQLLVTEAWRLPSDHGEDDGRHCLVIHTCDLEDEPWQYSWFPFATYARQELPFGSWGIPIVDDLEGIQEEINTLLMRASTAMRRCGAPHILVENDSEVNTEALDNDEGTIIRFTGPTPPTVQVAGNVVPPELYQQLDRLDAKAYQVTGVPQAQAQGEAPANLESGKAYQVYLQATDKRMKVAISNYHEMRRQLAIRIIALGKYIVENENPKYAVKVTPKRGGMRKVFFSDAQLDEEEYVLKLWPTNGLASDPGARMGIVEKWSDAGWIAPDQAKRLLDMPDLDEANSLENASYNRVEQAIEDALESGEWTEPDPFMNLEQAKGQITAAINEAERNRAPQDRIQILRDLLAAVGDLQAGIGEPETPQTQASAGGTPVAAAPTPGVTPVMMGAPPGPPGPGAPPPGPPPQG